MADSAQVWEVDGRNATGQVLRTALSLALSMQRPVRIVRLRSERQPAGLRGAHLPCIRGAERISNGTSQGSERGSEELTFIPGRVSTGDYEIDVGGAASACLVLQCLTYPLALAGGGTLRLRGGTHVPKAPSFHYLAKIWQPAIAALGIETALSLHSAGFPPEGGGEISVKIGSWSGAPELFEIASRGTLKSVQVTSVVAQMGAEVAERQAQATLAALREKGILADSESVRVPSMRSAGSAVLIRAQFERTFAGFQAIGERGAEPEQVGRHAASALTAFMASAGALDVHLADQLVIPAALMALGRLGAAARIRYRTALVTSHLKDQIALVAPLLGNRARVNEDGLVEFGPASA
ncbi:MAG: RNA 3'-terminal phosphate cyclase [Myxococcaceae bacterium]